MSKREKLVEYYENKLAKVEAIYSDDSRKEEYIEFAKKELEAVKNGRGW